MEILQKDLEKRNIHVQDSGKLPQIVELVKERLKTLNDIFPESEFFFIRPQSYDEKIISKKWNETVKEYLITVKQKLQDLQDWEPENISQILKGTLKEFSLKPGQALPLVRMAITGKKAGPDLHKIIHLLGKEETINRINGFLTAVETK